jgi:hypothetical protein
MCHKTVIVYLVLIPIYKLIVLGCAPLGELRKSRTEEVHEDEGHDGFVAVIQRMEEVAHVDGDVVLLVLPGFTIEPFIVHYPG